MSKRLAIWLILLLLSLSAHGQLSSKRCKWIKPGQEPFSLDTLTIEAGTVQFFNAVNEPLQYNYDPASARFSFTDSTATDSVFVCYRVLPLNLTAPRFRRDITKLDISSFKNEYYYEDFAVKEEILRTPGLNKTGSISRGISFGNTQNVFVNSALNLQMEGKLSEDISITAAISDQNIPFQPEGNTQQLQEFDRVYITLQHRLWTLTAGDVVLRNKPSNFLRYYKNVQGGALETTYGSSPATAASTSVAAALSKGKFASQNITPIESVQGPYRLTGPNGEKFLVVLANSERVFLDGRLLQRGFDFDYVIDYNQAEITFTPKHLITRNSRIRVDFEYSDRNYNRSVFLASHYQNFNKLKIQLNYFNEADNPNNPLTLELKQHEKELLRAIGDNLDSAFTEGADTVAFDRNQVLYQRVDTLVGGVPYQIYVYPPDSTKTVYLVRFTDVGPGNGDYVLASSAVNGRVYRWVAPVNGVRQGQFIPARILPTPRKKQMFTAGASYQLDEQTNVFFEAAASQNDLNRFSRRDSEDDDGKAFKVGYAIENKDLKFTNGYKLNSLLTYEFTDEYFVPIDRYRDIEFDRNWSTITSNSQISDNIFNFSVGAAKDQLNMVNYRISRRYRRSEVDGVQHWLDLAKQVQNFELKANLFMLNTTQAELQSEWVRGDVGLRYPTKLVVPGYVYRFDKNRIMQSGREDSVIASAMYFDEHVLFVQSHDSARLRYRLDYSYRQDLRPVRGELSNREIAQTYNGNVNTNIGKNNVLDLLLTYRELRLPSNRDTSNVSTIMAKIDWNGDFLDRHVRSELSYAIATGREQKRQFVFTEVALGQGTHVWRDINQDGIQTVDEFFEVQNATDGSRWFIKQFVPNDEYITAYTNRFNYRLTTMLPRNWRDRKGWRAFTSRFSTLTALTIDKKTTDEDLQNRFNPFSEEFDEASLISLSKSLRNTLYFNRSNPNFGLELAALQNQQKVLLTNGIDTRNVGSQNLLGRVNLTEVLSSRLNLTRAIRENRSDYLSNRNFRIISYEVAPELSYQPGTTLRFTGIYQFAVRENMLALTDSAGERGEFHELGLETRVSQVNKRTITGNIRYIKASFQGDENSTIGYEILNALRPGNNVTWSINVQQRLSNGLNIQLNYDGRKSNDVPAVHTGRMQVSVLF